MYGLEKLAITPLGLRQRSESLETGVLGEQHMLAIFPTSTADLARHRALQEEDHRRLWRCWGRLLPESGTRSGLRR